MRTNRLPGSVPPGWCLPARWHGTLPWPSRRALERDRRRNPSELFKPLADDAEGCRQILADVAMRRAGKNPEPTNDVSVAGVPVHYQKRQPDFQGRDRCRRACATACCRIAIAVPSSWATSLPTGLALLAGRRAWACSNEGREVWCWNLDTAEKVAEVMSQWLATYDGGERS